METPIDKYRVYQKRNPGTEATAGASTGRVEKLKTLSWKLVEKLLEVYCGHTVS